VIDGASDLKDSLAGVFHKDESFPVGVFPIIVKDVEYNLEV